MVYQTPYTWSKEGVQLIIFIIIIQLTKPEPAI